MTQPSASQRSSDVTLVTGATGLVGNNVVRLLRAAGEQVRVLARATTDRRALAGLDLEIVEGDIRDDAALVRACRGATAVIHCAGHVHIGWSKPELYDEINVQGTRRVAEACRAAGVRMVHVSSTDVWGSCSLEQPADEDTPEGPGPLVPYVVTKRAAEAEIRRAVDAGLDAVTVNPSFMLGPWDWKPSSGRMLLAVARGRAIMAPRGWFSLADVRDVAAGIMAARDRGAAGRRYILAGRTMEWIDAFRQIADLCGVRRPLCRVGPLVAWIGAWGGDQWEKFGRGGDINTAALRLGSIPKNYSSRRAEQELGYRNRPTAETLRDAWQWFREHGYR